MRCAITARGMTAMHDNGSNITAIITLLPKRREHLTIATTLPDDLPDVPRNITAERPNQRRFYATSSHYRRSVRDTLPIRPNHANPRDLIRIRIRRRRSRRRRRRRGGRRRRRKGKERGLSRTVRQNGNMLAPRVGRSPRFADVGGRAVSTRVTKPAAARETRAKRLGSFTRAANEST